MIRSIVIDDEPPARRKLRRLIEAEPDFEVAGEAESAAGAIDLIERIHPDLAFLDIGLPDASGFDVLEALESTYLPQIVFVTAFDEFAIKAFEVHALDYLLKPVEPSRFGRSLERVRQMRHSAQQRVDKLLHARHLQHSYTTRLLIQESGRSLFLETTRIDWIESARNYACIHAAGQTYIQRSTLDALATKLDPRVFRRISRTHIVNLRRIDELRGGSHGDSRIRLVDGAEFVWSRRYHPLSPTELEL